VRLDERVVFEEADEFERPRELEPDLTVHREKVLAQGRGSLPKWCRLNRLR
jgi:hypothetical protein